MTPEVQVRNNSVQTDNVRLLYNSNYQHQDIQYHNGKRLIFNFTQEQSGDRLNLSEDAHKAFMEIVGSDNKLEYNDLKNIDAVAKKYNISVDKSKLNDERKVTLNFGAGETLTLDFETEKESKEINDIIEAFTEPQDLMSKALRGCGEMIECGKAFTEPQDLMSKALRGCDKIIECGKAFTKDCLSNPYVQEFGNQLLTGFERVLDWTDRNNIGAYSK